MAFWDNLGQKASETTAKAMQKAKEISDIAKLNSMISEEENKINNTYYQIGKLYVSMHRHDCEEEFGGMVNLIDESNKKINEYKQQVQDIKGVVRCEKCGAEVQNGVAFCSSCGNPMPKVQMLNNEDMIKCEKCGAMVKKGMRFCTSCGNPIGQISKAQEDSEADMIKCVNCGAMVKSGMGFCGECGKPMEQLTTNVPETEEDKVIEKACPNCGTKVENDAVFCTECGAKIQ